MPSSSIMRMLVYRSGVPTEFHFTRSRGSATALAHVPRFVREMPVLNDYAFGGSLIWNGVKPFVDSRADLYGDIFLHNYAVMTSPDKDALAASLTFHHVRWTIFAREAPVVKLLDAMPGWRRHYVDKLAVIHVRD
jgi:hypothetical protein